MADPESLKMEAILDGMTVLEAAELAKALEEAWGVSAAAAVAVAAGSAISAAVVEEQAEFDVILTGDGGKKIQVIKEVRAITGMGFSDAKALVEGAPKPLKEGVNKAEAEAIKNKIEALGATIVLESKKSVPGLEQREFVKIVTHKIQQTLLEEPEKHLAFIRKTLAPVMGEL